MIGVCLALVFSPLIASSATYTWIPVIIVSLGAAATLHLTRFAEISYFVALLIVCYANQHITLWQATATQCIFVVLAAAIAILASLMWYPKRATRLVSSTAEEILSNYQSLFREILTIGLALPSSWTPTTKSDQLAKAITERKKTDAFALTLLQAQHEGLSKGPKQNHYLLSTLHQVYHHMVSLTHLDWPMGNNPLALESDAALRQGISHIERQLEAVRYGLINQQSDWAPSSSKKTKQELGNALTVLHPLLANATTNQVAAYFSLYNNLSALIDTLDEALAYLVLG